MSFKRTLSDYGSAVLGLVILYQIVRPRNDRMIDAMTTGFAQSIRAATGGAVIQDLRTAAEKFHEQAMRAIGEFWSGFTDE